MESSFTEKFKWNLPWLARHPFERAKSLLSSTLFEHKHVVLTVANHFEPAWRTNGVLDHKTQIERLKGYHKLARETGNSTVDADGTKFRHTNFYPAEQYHPEILDIMAEMQSEGLGEVEVHLHHGVEHPDTAENLRNTLVDFRDTLAERHKCLSREDGDETPRYAFVHGNLALANSCGGELCGVDNEMAILRDTGCYADMTLPSAPDRSQVAMTNSIYVYDGDPEFAVPHATGHRLNGNGKNVRLPLIMTGPLAFDMRTCFPRPRLDDGALTSALGNDLSRFDRWCRSNITVGDRTDVLFVKLYCHGFFDHDQSYSIGEEAARFFGEVVERGAKSGNYTVHFASAREMFNIAMAVAQGERGYVNQYRNFLLKPIMTS